MKKIIVLVVIILIIGFLWLKGKETETPMSDPSYLPSPTATNPDSTAKGIITTAPAPTIISPTPNATTATVKEFTVFGNNFSFTPDAIEVKKGDTVKVTFRDVSGSHNWKLEEFNVAIEQLKAGESGMIEFVADKTGSFEYYCSIGNHRAMGMKGTLTVK